MFVLLTHIYVYIKLLIYTIIINNTDKFETMLEIHISYIDWVIRDFAIFVLLHDLVTFNANSCCYVSKDTLSRRPR